MSALVPLLVTLPLLGAAIALIAGRHRRTQVAVSIVTLTLVLVIAAVLLLVVVDAGNAPIAVSVGGWPIPFGIVLYVDRLAALLVVVSSIVLLAVLLFSVGQGAADGDDDTPVSIFHPSYLILAAGIFTAFIAGDLFNLYVGFEILLVASYVLITLGSTESRIRTGVVYIVVSLVSSILFLAAIAMIYGALGTVNMVQISERMTELPQETQLVLHLHAAAGVQHQGRRLPAVVLAARLLSDRAGAGHRRVRRPADEGRRLRADPHRDRSSSRQRRQLRC